jgi:hypothetical protein
MMYLRMRYLITENVDVHPDVGFVGSTHLSESNDENWTIMGRYEMPNMTSLLCFRGEELWIEANPYQSHGIVCRNEIFRDCYIYCVNGGTSGDLVY